MLDKKIVEPMTQEAIANVVNSLHGGSSYYIEWLDGAPIKLTEGTLYVTKRTLACFKNNYSKLTTVRIEKAIYKANSLEDINTCERLLTMISNEQKECISAKTLGLLAQKKIDVASGKKIFSSEKRKVSKEHDEKNPFLVYCNNGNILLQCYRSYLKKIVWKDGIRSFERRKIENHYYVVHDDGVCEEIKLDTASPALVKALSKAVEESRTLAGKKPKGGSPTPIYTPSIHNIIMIAGRKE